MVEKFIVRQKQIQEKLDQLKEIKIKNEVFEEPTFGKFKGCLRNTPKIDIIHKIFKDFNEDMILAFLVQKGVPCSYNEIGEYIDYSSTYVRKILNRMCKKQPKLIVKQTKLSKNRRYECYISINKNEWERLT